jgi:hypothetical protein
MRRRRAMPTGIQRVDQPSGSQDPLEAPDPLREVMQVLRRGALIGIAGPAASACLPRKIKIMT